MSSMRESLSLFQAPSRRCASLRAAAWRKPACRIPGGRSSTPISNALGIGKIIAFSLSLDDVSSGKPDPEPFREAARRLGAEPHATVAVEDSGAGARSARAAGPLVVRLFAVGRALSVGADRSIAELMEVVALFGT